MNEPSLSSESNQFSADDKRRLEKELERLRNQVRKCESEIDRLRELSGTDELTQLANRRSFDHELQRRLAEQRRFGHKFCLLLLDIDGFKQVNDSCGHLGGDRLLREFAAGLSREVRQADLLARYGGDEFAVILAGTELENAKLAARRLLDVTLSNNRPEIDGINLSVSIGIAQAEPDDTAETLIHKADRALYDAKHGGGNRVCWN